MEESRSTEVSLREDYRSEVSVFSPNGDPSLDVNFIFKAAFSICVFELIICDRGLDLDMWN